MMSPEARKTQSYDAGRNGDVLPAYGDWMAHSRGVADRLHAPRQPRWDDPPPSSGLSSADAGAGFAVLLLIAWYLALVIAMLALLLVHLACSALLAVPRGLMRSFAQLGDVQLGFLSSWADAPQDRVLEALDAAQEWLDRVCRKAISILPFEL